MAHAIPENMLSCKVPQSLDCNTFRQNVARFTKSATIPYFALAAQIQAQTIKVWHIVLSHCGSQTLQIVAFFLYAHTSPHLFVSTGLPGPIPNLVSHVTQLTITLSWVEAFNNGAMIENYTIIIQRGTTTVFTAFTDGFSTSISRFNLKQTVDDNNIDVEYTAIIYARNIFGNGPKVSVLFTVIACE